MKRFQISDCRGSSLLPILLIGMLTASPTVLQAQNVRISAPIGQTTKAKSVSVTNASDDVATVKSTGAANTANGQVTTSTTAGTAVAARATRRSVTIKNIDLSITVYVGIATVTAANGMELKPGESFSIDSTALIQVIAASGTPKIAYLETYD